MRFRSSEPYGSVGHPPFLIAWHTSLQSSDWLLQIALQAAMQASLSVLSLGYRAKQSSEQRLLHAAFTSLHE
jgi:squalene cyclase